MRPQPQPSDRDCPEPGAGTPSDAPVLPDAQRRPTPGAGRRSVDADIRPGYFDRPIDEQDDEDERVSVLARLTAVPAALRSNPRTVQRASIGVIAAGVAVFVAASLSTPLAAADTRAPTVASGREFAAAAAKLRASAATTDSTPPAARQVLQRKPTKAKTTAPVDHGTISGLAANGIPEVALNAYRVAAARMRHVDPSCGIDWALLAGIGRVESDHGRFGGAQLLADGTSSKRIIGPALDGKHWDYIAAPANGIALADDPTYAHALGPMQFIPSTWAIYGTDANGDGKADIFNINDAALGAARYLCAAGGDLKTHAGQVRAVLAYNHSDKYLAEVLALAEAYRTGVAVTGIPNGNTTGALPKVTDHGYVPPVNPADPTALDPGKRKATKAGNSKTTLGGQHGAAKSSSTNLAPSSSTSRPGTSSSSPKSGSSSATSTSPSSTPTKAPSSGSSEPGSGAGSSGTSSSGSHCVLGICIP